MWVSDGPFVGHDGQFAYRAIVDWLVDAIPDAAARAKIFGATARALYFNGGASLQGGALQKGGPPTGRAKFREETLRQPSAKSISVIRPRSPRS